MRELQEIIGLWINYFNKLQIVKIDQSKQIGISSRAFHLNKSSGLHLIFVNLSFENILHILSLFDGQKCFDESNEDKNNSTNWRKMNGQISWQKFFQILIHLETSWVVFPGLKFQQMFLNITFHFSTSSFKRAKNKQIKRSQYDSNWSLRFKYFLSKYLYLSDSEYPFNKNPSL